MDECVAGRGVELAAWILRDAGPEQTINPLVAVGEAGAATIIAAEPVTVLGYLGLGRIVIGV